MTEGKGTPKPHSVISNTSSSNDNGGESSATLAVSGLVIALALVSVALRFYVRIITKAGLWWDDQLVLAAVVFTLLTAVLLLWGNSVNPNGLRVSENTDPNYVYTPHDVFYLKLAYVTSLLYFTIASSTKLSILLMYNRLFSVNDAFRRQLVVTSALVFGFWIGCTIADLTNCIPLKWSWINSLADPRYCFNYNIFWTATGACEVLLDVLILALPIRVVLALQLSPRKKVTVACIFLLGGFVIITGLVRTILGYVPGGRVPSYSRTEVWTTVHTGMAIVCACLPIFRPLIKRITKSVLFSKFTGFSRSRSSRGQSMTNNWGKNNQGRGEPRAARKRASPPNRADEDSFGTKLRTDSRDDNCLPQQLQPLPKVAHTWNTEERLPPCLRPITTDCYDLRTGIEEVYLQHQKKGYVGTVERLLSESPLSDVENYDLMTELEAGYFLQQH